MNTELFIAKRIIKESNTKNKFSKPMIRIALIGIALGLAVMILSVAISIGFNSQISNKIVGFGSHIQIVNFDSNQTYETEPINREQDFLEELKALKGVKNVQAFCTKPGIIKVKENIQVVYLKGIDKDFDWSFFNENIVEGESFIVTDSVRSNKILISQYYADLLDLSIGEKINIVFVQDNPRIRRFEICGIYKTNLSEFDEQIAVVDMSVIQSVNNWNKNQISGFEVQIEDFDQLDYMYWTVKDIAGFSFNEDGSRLLVQNIKQIAPLIFSWLDVTKTNVWVIIILMLIVSGINMITGLLITILERVNMIGILKALGTQTWSVRKIFLYQAAYLILRGMFWGNLVGLSLAFLQKYFNIIKLDPNSYYINAVPIEINWFLIIALNIGTLIVTYLMLIIPSYIIAKISPVKTIRFN